MDSINSFDQRKSKHILSQHNYDKNDEWNVIVIINIRISEDVPNEKFK